MKLKKIACLLLFTLPVTCAEAQTTNLQRPEWKATVKVIDESEEPVPGATAQMSWNVNGPDNSLTYGKTEGITDDNGILKTSHEANSSIGLAFVATKAGYYSSRKGYELAQLKDNDPAKWNPNVTLVLRKIGQPIPMYAKRVETKVQKEDEPIGFDLMMGDWVAPYGKGKDIDMLFSVRRKIINEREYDCDLRLTFPNRGDGIVVAPYEPETGSSFRTSRTAVESGYESELSLRFSTGTRPPPVFGYYFRVRTVVDEKGNVKSALYGKIPGDFRFYAGTKAPRAGMGFDYYLNPIPNDQNLEFDPSQNLLKGLAFDQQIKEP